MPADPEKLDAATRDGYYSPEFYHVSDARYASCVKEVAGRTTFDTLLLPSRSEAGDSVRIERLPVGTLSPDGATALELRFGDGSRGTYYKSWLSKASRSFGSYTFDGKLVYVEEGADQAVESIAIYDASRLEHDGEVVVASPVPVQDLSSSRSKCCVAPRRPVDRR